MDPDPVPSGQFDQEPTFEDKWIRIRALEEKWIRILPFRIKVDPDPTLENHILPLKRF